MSRTEQPVAEWLSGLTAVSSIAAGDKFAVLQSGVVKSATDSNITALIGEPTSIGDYDISTANTSITLASAFSSLAVGGKIRYSWSGGDGTYTFSWSDGASYTLNGITADNYIGEGVGHIDIIKTATTTGNIINAGEIWDNDGGNFNSGDSRYDKYLNGRLIQYGNHTATDTQTTVSLGWYRNDPNIDVTYALTFVAAIDPIITSAIQYGAAILDIGTQTATGFSYFTYRGNSNAVSSSLPVTYMAEGRWTPSYPRIT